jgi:hypothetical protein
MTEESIYADDPWHLAHEKNEPAGPRLIALCRELARKQTVLIQNTEMCMGVYEYGGQGRALDPGDVLPIEETIVAFNAAQNIVDTVYSKVVKSRIIPMPLTNGGGYLQRYRAKQLGKAVEGVFDDNNVEEIEEDVVMDALTTDHGAGACLVFEQDDEVKIEHIPIEDIWWDEAETRNRAPRNCYRVPKGGIDKYVACELFGKDDLPGGVGTGEQRRAAILAAANKPETWRQRGSGQKSRVDLFESWHLPSGKVEECDEEYEETNHDGDVEKKTRKVRKHDGRHVVAVDGPNGTLIDEPWEGPMFPVLMYVPRKRRRTVLGLSLIRDLIAPQREYEKVTAKIQDQHQKMGVSGWSGSRDANLNIREVTSGTFGAAFFVEHDGPQGVTQLTTEPVSPGTYQYAEGIPRLMAERKGVSTLATASQLPSGLQQASGKALQVFEDFEDVRLLPYHRGRERFIVALSWLVIHAAKRICDRNVKYRSRYRGKHGLEVIEWKKVLEDADDFVLKVFPISALSRQPAARFAQLTELLNAQAITVEQFKRLFEIPDLEAENEMDLAHLDIIDMNLDTMVVEGRYITPLPTDQFALQIERAGKFYNLCRIQKVPEERLKLILDFIEDTKSLEDQIKAEEAAKKAAMAPPPPAAPMPPDPNAPLPPPDGGPPVPPDGGVPMPDPNAMPMAA